MMRLNELAAIGGFKPRFQKHDAASVDIMRWVWVAIYFRCPNWFWLCSGSVAMVVLFGILALVAQFFYWADIVKKLNDRLVEGQRTCRH
jgi:hypothetical protein